MTPREPDRYREKAERLYAAASVGDCSAADIAAAFCEVYAEGWNMAVAELDLASPAAAPAAETVRCMCPSGAVAGSCPLRNDVQSICECRCHGAPPSEPAAPALDRCPFEEKDCLEARVLLHQCAKALRGVLAHAEWLDKHLGRLPNTDEENARTVLAKLAARTSPGAAGEGT